VEIRTRDFVAVMSLPAEATGPTLETSAVGADNVKHCFPLQRVLVRNVAIAGADCLSTNGSNNP